MACRRSRDAAAALLLALTITTADAGISSWEANSDDDYHLFVENRMSQNMQLSCNAVQAGGRSEFYFSFRADPGGGEVEMPFLQPAARARLVCKWAYDGNYLRGVTLFSAAWREAWSGACRRRGGGCTLLFDRHEMFVVARAGGRRPSRLLGDLPEHECEKMLLVFNGRCWYKHHRHPYVGRVMNGLTDYMMA